MRWTSRIKSSGYSNISGLHAFGIDRNAFKLKCEIHGQLYCHISYVFENHHHYSCPFAESTKGRMSNSVRCGFHPNLMQTFSYNYWMILNTERNHVITQHRQHSGKKWQRQQMVIGAWPNLNKPQLSPCWRDRPWWSHRDSDNLHKTPVENSKFGNHALDPCAEEIL